MINKLTKLLFENDDEVGMRDDPHLKVTKGKDSIGDYYQIEYGQMYSSPTLNFGTLSTLSDMFKTIKINNTNYAYSGCETCDHGSDYGHTITLYQVTQYNHGLDLLVKMGKLKAKDNGFQAKPKYSWPSLKK